MTAAEQLVARTRAEQGLPRRVEHPGTLAQIARMLADAVNAGPLQSRRSPSTRSDPSDVRDSA